MDEENTQIDTFIQGTCVLMCPQNEISFREKEGLLHVLETINGTENCRIPIADPLKAVKSYSRSAAGQKMPEPSEIRPHEILLQTVRYLFHCVVSNENMEWFLLYEFTFDRLRSVRQDMVIQNLRREHTISLLELITRFYSYAHYRLCEETLDKFDPKINKTHLLECLKRLLVLYDEGWMVRRLEGEAVTATGCTRQISRHLQQFSLQDGLLTDEGLLLSLPAGWALLPPPPPPPPRGGRTTYDPYNLLGWRKDERNVRTLGFFRPHEVSDEQMAKEALYLLLNLGDSDAMARASQFLVSHRWPTHWTITYKIAQAYVEGNYVRVCRLIPLLPATLALAATQHLPAIRRHGLRVMSVAFSSPTLTYPLHQVATLLLFHTLDEAAQECRHYGIKVSAGQVSFRKGSFDAAAPLRPARRVHFIDKVLADCNITEVLLGMVT